MWYSGTESIQKIPVQEWDEDSRKCQKDIRIPIDIGQTYRTEHDICSRSE